MTLSVRWISHAAIAGSTTAILAPSLVPLAIIGSTAPDWLETVFNKFLGQRFQHRQETHYLTHWFFACVVFFVVDFHGIGLAFAYGGLTHVLADSLTVSGVPFSPLSNRRFHLFGGRLVTGSFGEYLTAALIVAISFFIARSLGVGGRDFYPFFYEWWNFYETGLLDGSEWRKNRFRFF